MIMTVAKLKKLNACANGVQYFKKHKFTSVEQAITEILKTDHKDRHNWSNWLISNSLSKEDYIRYAVYAAEQVIDIFEKKYPEDNRPREAIKAIKRYLKNPSEENKEKCQIASDAAYTAADAAAYAAAAADDAAYAAAAAAAYAADAAAKAAKAADAAAKAAAAAYAADAAAKAAAAAAYAADAAAKAAKAADAADAAYAAADAAAKAAAYAAKAAAKAAYAAAYTAEYNKMLEKIVRYGLKLLKENKKFL